MENEQKEEISSRYNLRDRKNNKDEEQESTEEVAAQASQNLNSEDSPNSEPTKKSLEQDEEEQDEITDAILNANFRIFKNLSCRMFRLSNYQLLDVSN